MRTVRLVSAAIAVALLAAACSGSLDDPDAVVPGLVPEDFPVPAGATVERVDVDRATNNTSVEMVVPEDLDGASRTFSIGLVNAGYVIDGSGGSSAQWVIQFSRGELIGTINLFRDDNSPGTRALVTLNVS